MTRERWIGLAIAAITIVFTLMLLALLDEAEPQRLQPETLSRHERRLIELDRQAVDQAYIAHAANVFGIWLKDGVGDPSRAKVGFGNARKGYDAATTAIEVREQRLKQEQEK